MTKSYKMVVLDAMLHAGQLPGEMTVPELAQAVIRLTRYSPDLRSDFEGALDDARDLEGLLRDNPINAWVGGGTPNKDPYFELEGDRFRTLFKVKGEEREAFQDLAAELVEWRLSQYLDRAPSLATARRAIYSCNVSHAGEGRPMLFLPARQTNPGLPEGWTEIVADGDPYEANFVKVALNVIRHPETTENVLPQKLLEWFGPNAGASGTNHKVTLAQEESGWVLKPELGGPQTGQSLMRAEIPPLFGLEFVATTWQQGYVPKGNRIFLLVTLEKQGMSAEHQYGDRFLTPEIFEWQSQNRHKQDSKAGQAMLHHAENGTAVHLFVRKRGKIGSKAAPFIYCGEVEFVDWEGNQPITIRWKLRQVLNSSLTELFEVSRP